MDEAKLAKAAQTMRVDRATLDVVRAFADAGVPSVVLKGPAIAKRLYENRLRGHSDVDVLVPPGEHARAQELLVSMGFQRDWVGSVFPGASGAAEPACAPDSWERYKHATTWVKPGHPPVDLHHSFHYLSADREHVWSTLSTRTTGLDLFRGRITVLDLPAQAMVIGLHACADCEKRGELGDRSREDLARAIAAWPLEVWQEALALVRELGAERALVKGLALVPAGEDLIRRLKLRPPSREEAREGPAKVRFGDTYLEAFLEAPGLVAKARVARSMLVPSADFVRLRWPLARGGRVALAVGYGLHLGNVVVRVPGTVRRLLKKRRLGS